MAFPETLIVSVSGIRGRVGLDLTPDVVATFAAAYGSFVRERGWGTRVALARDSRPSGPAFAQAAAAALRSVGCDVEDLGLVPTPTALLHVQDEGLAGGIVITASHNPKEWNALKLASADGAFLTRDQGASLVAAVEEQRRPDYVGWDAFGEGRPVEGAVDHHIARILGLTLVDPDAIAGRGLRVALDCTRGAGGVIMPALLERLGCTVLGLDLEPDGRFTREPEPTGRNLDGLCELVRHEGADLGMAVDPDVDRLALVDGAGRAIGEDYTLALATRFVLDHETGPVVANLSTSQIVEEVCRRGGAPFHRAPVGEANVAERMREVGAVVGGEGNGGVMLASLHLTRDAPLAAALILGLVAERQARLEEIVAEYPQFHMVRERAPRPDLELGELYGEIQKALPDGEIDRSDGFHIRWPERRMWLHVRPSGTEPILRLMAECPVGREGDLGALVQRVRQLSTRGGSVHGIDATAKQDDR